MLDIGMSIKTLKSHVKQNVTADHLIGDVLDILEVLNKNVDGNTLMLSYVKIDKPQEELKPCPCCGGGNISIYYKQNGNKTFYRCENCGIRTANFATEHEAKATWQRRSNA